MTRGPVAARTAQLAHRRLSIIDLSTAADQPLADGLHLSYNGELYNYRDRASACRTGGSGCHVTGTEVVPSPGGMGSDALSRFRGMFASLSTTSKPILAPPRSPANRCMSCPWERSPVRIRLKALRRP
jgi:asparagine synthetase B (glutamine-hydrolysing)